MRWTLEGICVGCASGLALLSSSDPAELSAWRATPCRVGVSTPCSSLVTATLSQLRPPCCSFAGWVILMTIFIFFFLPETKGVPVERIHVSALRC